MRNGLGTATRFDAPVTGVDDVPTLTPIEAAERQALIDAIRTTSGNMARAAALLRVSRSTLYRRCKDLHITYRTH